MSLKIIALCIVILPFIVGCVSSTPGDAAHRGGHFEQAADLYRYGAERGDKTAALKLGLMLTENEINNKGYGDAIKWFIKACELGSVEGCYNTGNIYAYPENIDADKDYKKAHKYYIMAAEKGFMQSQYNLGTLYSEQHFNNDIEGLKWMLIAKKSAYTCSDMPLCKWIIKDTSKQRTKLISRMSKEQIANAQKQADTWTTKQ